MAAPVVRLISKIAAAPGPPLPGPPAESPTKISPLGRTATCEMNGTVLKVGSFNNVVGVTWICPPETAARNRNLIEVIAAVGIGHQQAVGLRHPTPRRRCCQSR